MARRRINTKPLAILFTVFVVVAGGLTLYKKFLVKENPQPYVDAGNTAFAAKKWDVAVIDYGKAVSLAPNDAVLLAKYGQSLVMNSPEDFETNMKAASIWQQAVQIKPDYKEAWHSLLGAYERVLEMAEFNAAMGRGKADVTGNTLAVYMGRVRDTAAQVSRIDPTDAQVKAIAPMLDIRMWLRNLPIPMTQAERELPSDKRPTDEQKVQQAIVTLTQTLHDDPGNTQVAKLIGLAKIRQYQNLVMRTPDAPGSDSLLTEASQVFDAPLRAQPKNVNLYMGRFELLMQLSVTDRRPEMRKQYSQQMREVIETAQGMVDPKDQADYLRVKLTWAKFLTQIGSAKAEASYQEIINKVPSDYRAQLDLAGLLKKDPTRRGDALAILGQIPMTVPANSSSNMQSLLDQVITSAKLLRLDIETDQLRSATDGKERDRLSSDITTLLDSFPKSMAEDWHVMKMRGKLQMAQVRYRDAVQTLAASASRMKELGQRDTDLLILLADAYRQAHLTTDAIKVLQDALQDPMVYNTNIAAHEALVQLALEDRNVDLAKLQLPWLQVRYPNNPAVIQYQISTMDPRRDKDAIDALYKKLPETSPVAVVDKARVAASLGNLDDAVRLFKDLQSANPADPDIAYQLATFYSAQGKKDAALKTVEEALKLNPSDPRLNLLRDAFNGKTDNLEKLTRENINAIPDKYVRAMKMSQLDRQNGDTDAEVKDLNDALAAQSGNGTALQRLFEIAIARHQFDKAAEYVDTLAQNDADQAHGQLFRIRLALAKGDTESALALGRQVTNDFPEFSASWQYLGEALQASGQLEAAITKYQAALDKQAGNTNALQNLISCEKQLNHLDEAKRYITEARRRFPNEAYYRQLQVGFELQYGDPELVLPDLMSDLSAHPDDETTYRMVASALVRAAAVKSAHQDDVTSKKHLAEARDVLQRGVAKWPDDLPLASDLAIVCLQSDDLPAGEAVLRAIADRPVMKDHAEPLVALAQLYSQANRPEQAETQLRQAMTLSKNSPEVSLKLANVLAAQRKYADALSVLKVNSGVFPILQQRVDMLLNLSRGTDAENEVSEALKPAPKNVLLNNLMVYVLYNQQKYEQARKMAGDLVAADSTNLGAYYYRGLVSLKGNNPDVDGAVRDLTYVRDHDAANVNARIALADALVKKSDMDGAIRELETALTTSPQNKPLRLKLVEFYNNTKPPRYIDTERTLTGALAMPQFKTDVDFLRAAALMYARRGDSDKALQSIQAAMAAVPNKAELTNDYFNILLVSKNYSLLLTESDPLATAANAPWWVFDYRGRARARSSDVDGAVKEFEQALNLSGVDPRETGHVAASTLASHMAADIGLDKTLAMVGPRARNSVAWKLVAIPLYDRKGDEQTAVSLAEAGMQASDSVSPMDMDELMNLSAALYASEKVPQVDKALAVYRKILDKRPGDISAMNNVACMLTDAAIPPDPKQALVYSQKAYDAVRASGHIEPVIADTHGWVLIRNGQIDAGIQILTDVIDNAAFPDIHYHLAEGYLAKNRPSDARRELDTAVSMIDTAVAENRHVDGSLRAKVDDASKRADKMLQNKTQAAVSP